jgi:hypothetical protein
MKASPPPDPTHIGYWLLLKNAVTGPVFIFSGHGQPETCWETGLYRNLHRPKHWYCACTKCLAKRGLCTEGWTDENGVTFPLVKLKS